MKKMLTLSAVLLAGTAAFAQTPATTQAPPPPASNQAPRPFADKVMTRAEAIAMVRDHFASLDSDKDGSITTAEVASQYKQMGDREMRHHGPMGDPNTGFDRLDSNKDGSISRDEFAKGREERIEKRIVIRDGKAEAGADGTKRFHHRGMGGMGGMGGARMIVLADTNKDGRITLAEAETLALQHFDRMDSNHDGQVTSEERRAARPEMIREFREHKPS